MKIIFVCNDDNQCGIADYSKYLLQELIKLVDVEVIFMPRFKMPSGLPSSYVINAFRAFFLPIRLNPSISAMFNMNIRCGADFAH